MHALDAKPGWTLSRRLTASDLCASVHSDARRGSHGTLHALATTAAPPLTTLSSFASSGE
eukprot:1992122-Pleurochrysis_carterae.AAC.1